jgi:hypothetical protein
LFRGGYLGDLVLTVIQSPGLSLNWNFIGNGQTMRGAYDATEASP